MAHPPEARTAMETGEGVDGGAAVRESLERAILGIWRDVARRADIGVQDNLFAGGGHTLVPAVVSRIRTTLGVDIPVMDVFESGTVAALASAVAARSAAAKRPSAARVVTPRPPDAEPVLSFDQQRLWMESQLLPGAVYNVHGRRRLVGPLDVAVLEASVRAILARHEALRTRFPTVDGRPVQVVDDPDDGWRLRVEDLTGIEGDRAATARRLLDRESATPFDLTRGPLLRCLLIRLSDDEHLLGVTMHHIVSDGRSIALFVRELSALYQAGGDARRADLPALGVQYRDYAVWQRRRLVGEELERQVSYWRRHLTGAPPVLALPTGQRRSTSQGAEADRIEYALSGDEAAALHELCRNHGVTPFMTLLAGLATVLGRWAGQSDVVIGAPISGRNHSGTEHLIGSFLNVLPFRVDLSGDPSFTDLLRRVHRIALDGYAHADAPLDVLVEDLQVVRDPRRTPLFEVVLNVLASPEAERVAGLVVEPMETPSLFSRFDLSVSVQEDGGALVLKLDFGADRLDATMVRILVGHLCALLRGAAADPGRGILDYPFPAAEETAAEETAAEETAAGESWPAPHQAVDRQAWLPDRTAVIDREGRWSYRWLAAAADRVALFLQPRNLHQVALVSRPAAAFVAALLGCAKAGARFSVVDPASPAGSDPVLDVSPNGGNVEGTIDLSAVLHGPAELAPASQPDASVDWAAGRFDLRSDDRFAVLSGTSGHLMSALSSALHVGATVVLPDRSLHRGADAAEWLRANAISVVYVTAPMLRVLAAGARLPALRYAFVDNSGELIPHDVEALHAVSPVCRCVGMYRVDRNGRPLATFAVPDDWSPETAPLRVPLGVELPGAPVRLLLPSGQRAAVGEVGEIWFGSSRTGDLGRRWPDGSLEFVGRIGADPTVDLLETVAALRDLPGVRDALVTGPSGYVVGPDPGQGGTGILNQLRTRLPAYLIPERLLVLDELPLTAGGDYDPTALPAPDAEVATVEAYVAPRTPMESQLAGILQELLEVDRVGVHDSFFELGGFSLLATQLTTRIRAAFHVDVALREVFESPTVDELAQLIVRTQGELSGIEDLEALLAETESLGRTDAPGPDSPVDEADGSGRYERIVARLRESVVFAADKPDETAETSAQALWYAAAGAPRPVTRVSLPLPTLSAEQELVLDGLIARRLAGEPLAYLSGLGSFMGLDFRTDPGALIPRRETELLGGAVLSLAKEIASAASAVRILDLGTGSGNLAVALAVLEPRARVWACDLEPDAVAVAGRNAAFHGVSDRVRVARGDLFGALEEISPPPGPFDLVVCNPPYMPTEKARSLAVEIGGFEPTAAFDGGDVGLSILYRLIAQAPRHLVPGGWVCFELGAGMGRVLERRLAARGAYGEVRTVVDADGITRAILARRLP